MGEAVSHFEPTARMTYFLPPDNNPEDGTPHTETIIHDTGPVCRVPEHWVRDHFLVDGIPVYFYVARAERELGVMVGCSGLKSDRPLSADVVKAYNDEGISVIMMALPNPGRSLGFMPYFRKVFERFALDNQSPVGTLFHKDLPRFLYGHSTGGQILINFLTSSLHSAGLKSDYKMAIAEGPFCDTANASLHHSKWISRTVFNLYACFNRKALPKETLFGLYYLHYHHHKKELTSRLPKDASAIRKIPVKAAYILNTAVRTIRDLYFPTWNREPEPWFQRECEYRTPTYGQILEDQYAGRKMLEMIALERTKTSIPLNIVAAEDDPFSCSKTARHQVADPLGASIYFFDGQHNTLSEDPAACEYSLAIMRPYLLEEPPLDLNASLGNAMKPEYEPEGRWSIETLSNRFGRFFQSATRIPNPFASLTKRLF